MKKFFTTIAALLPLTTLIAQTFINQDFGKNPDQVAEFLKSKHMVHTTVSEAGTLVASTETYTVTYYFDEGGLYKVETVSDFAQRKDALVKMAEFKAQFLQATSQVMDLADGKEVTRFAALTGRELYEVSSHAIGKNGAQIRLLSLDLDRAPGVAMNELRQDNLLFAMVSK
jgi:hypothetical protein